MRKQRGYIGPIGPTTGELMGCAALAGLACAVLGGGLLFVAIPRVWEWLKPILHQLTA